MFEKEGSEDFIELVTRECQVQEGSLLVRVDLM